MGLYVSSCVCAWAHWNSFSEVERLGFCFGLLFVVVSQVVIWAWIQDKMYSDVSSLWPFVVCLCAAPCSCLMVFPADPCTAWASSCLKISAVTWHFHHSFLILFSSLTSFSRILPKQVYPENALSHSLAASLLPCQVCQGIHHGLAFCCHLLSISAMITGASRCQRQYAIQVGIARAWMPST